MSSKTGEIAISVHGVTKSFRLPHEKTNSMKGLFVNMFRGGRSYEKQKVLKDVSFDVKKGEFLGIVGRNGGGKSTLLKLLAGIYSPDSGAVTINGKLTPFIELGVGFSPELTGRENVYLNGALFGFDRKEMDAMYDEIVAFAELEKFMDQKLKNYSSGMQVRLAFSIAVRANTDILVLDEVLAVGDENFQQKCLQQFRSFKKEGKTIILVSHSMDMIEKFCDRAIVISKGQVEFDGDPTKAIEEYRDLNLQSSEASHKKAMKKDITIEGVDLLNKDGKKVNSMSGGENFSVRVAIRSARAQNDLFMGLKVCEAESQLPILGFNNLMDDAHINLKAGLNEIVIRFDDHLRMSGRFYILVGLYKDKSRGFLFDNYNGAVSNSYILFKDAENGAGSGLLAVKRKWITKK